MKNTYQIYNEAIKFSPLWINVLDHWLTGIEAKPFFFRIKALEYRNQGFFFLFEVSISPPVTPKAGNDKLPTR